MTYASDEAIANMKWNAENERYCAAADARRPSVLYRPALTADGTKWCALYGEDLASGVAGFGDTPAEAMYDFDKAWTTERTPSAAFSARSNPVT